jgi:hypothetical protein
MGNIDQLDVSLMCQCIQHKTFEFGCCRSWCRDVRKYVGKWGTIGLLIVCRGLESRERSMNACQVHEPGEVEPD